MAALSIFPGRAPHPAFARSGERTLVGKAEARGDVGERVHTCAEIFACQIAPGFVEKRTIARPFGFEATLQGLVTDLERARDERARGFARGQASDHDRS